MSENLGIAPIVAAQIVSTAKGRSDTEVAVPKERLVKFNSKEQRWVNGMVIITGLTVLGGVTFLVGRSIYRGIREKSSLNQSDDQEKAANFALRIRQAFFENGAFGWGTDEVLLRRTLTEIPDQIFWEKVKKAYHAQTKGSILLDDMRSELTPSEFDGMIAIVQSKPLRRGSASAGITMNMLTGWARRIKAASEAVNFWMFPGTDEEAIYQVMREIPLARHLIDLDQIYRARYSKGLLVELTDELDQEELRTVYSIIKTKPDAKGKSITQIFT